MTDIIARLRNLGWETCHEAAEEIERLQTAKEYAFTELMTARAEIERHMREKVALAGLVAKERDQIERLRALSQNNAHSWDTVVRERDGLRAEIERLRALVKELADDLEAEVEGRKGNTKDYPSELRRYERDIDSVRRARAALEPKP